jgi:hypothetical protein|tara:strand:+ start:4389 stop:4772 length:384 start_codon:yes stop_codon:yes gene_type:complete
MKLKLNTENVGIEEMRQLVALHDEGVLEVDYGQDNNYLEVGSKLIEEKKRITKGQKISKKLLASWKRRKAKRGKRSSYLSKEMKELIAKRKKSNTSFLKIAIELNKKFGTNLTKKQLKQKCKRLKGV